MNALTELFLSRRGYTPDILRQYNCSDHELLGNVDCLCEQLYEIRENQEQIVVLPDFDTDGIMSAIVGLAGLSELGFYTGLHTPDPQAGYGFKRTDIDQIHAHFPDAHWIITCDVGITCSDAIEYARQLGIRTLVTDHHPQKIARSGGVMPCSAEIVVDPMVDQYHHKGICGAHVLWQVLDRFAEIYHNETVRLQISRLRVFAGIATIADSMPLLYENRELVKDSFSLAEYLLNDGNPSLVSSLQGHPFYRNAFYGLFVLLDKIRRRTEDKGGYFKIDEDLYGFSVCPPLNCSKRMYMPTKDMFDVFFSGNPDPAVERLLEINSERKKAVEINMAALENREQPYAPFVYLTDAGKGMHGLMAGKLIEAHEQKHPEGFRSAVPVMVVDEKTGYGSGRSMDWFDFIKEMRMPGVFMDGHQQAFGFGFASGTDPQKFIEILSERVRTKANQLISQGKELGVTPDIRISMLGDGDAGLDIGMLMEFLDDLDELRPFGKQFAKPRIRFRFDPKQAEWEVFGSERNHIRLLFPYGFEIKLWNTAHRLNELKSMSVCELEGNFVWDYYPVYQPRHLSFSCSRIIPDPKPPKRRRKEVIF